MKKCIVSHKIYFSTKKREQKLLNGPIIFHFPIYGKLSIIQCELHIFSIAHIQIDSNGKCSSYIKINKDKSVNVS